MAYTFLFDSSFCTGCKTCQAACKDKNQLPAGILWRRVYEISAGSWQKDENAWTTDVYAYNISMSCNHCEHPKCAGVCPTNAYSIRLNGIVHLDMTRCVGCGYCNWACPYGAPQFNQLTGRMTKCDFCEDYLEQGKPPACVAACPMRCLEIVDLPDLGSQTEFTQEVAPLPDPTPRNPRFLIKPHPALSRSSTGDPQIVNQEEVNTRLVGRFEEAPLVAFTLLAQMAVGAFWGFTGLFNLITKGFGDLTAGQNSSLTHYSIGVLIFLSLLLSFRHLGYPRNAWRVFAHLRKSWLSREILFTTLFAGLWLVSVFFEVWHVSSNTRLLLSIITSFFGFAAVWSMSRVYRLATVPAWNTWRTSATFFTSTLFLGFLYSRLLNLFSTPISTWSSTYSVGTGTITALLFIFNLFLLHTSEDDKTQHFNRVRQALILVGLFGSNLMVFFPGIFRIWMIIPLFILAALVETIGRINFYERRSQLF